MAHWQSRSGQWDPPSHSEGDSLSYPLSHQPSPQSIGSASRSFSHSVGNESHLSQASDAPEMPHANAHNYYTPHSQEHAGVSQHQPLVSGMITPNAAAYHHHHHHNPILHEPTRGSQLQSSILATNNSHSQDPAGSYANPQSQLQFYTGSMFDQQPPAANQSEHHGSSNLVHSVPHGPAPTGTTVLYPASFDLSMSQAASSYGYHNTLSAAGGQHQPGGSDIRPAHDTSAYSNYPPPYSQNFVGGSHNSLVLSQPPSSAVSAFQQACSQYPQDGSSNLNVAQSAPQGPAFPSTSLYDPNTSQAASAYGYCDSQPAADSQHQPEASNAEPAHHAAAHSNYRHPYSQGPVGGNYNNPVQSELLSSTVNASRQSVGEVLRDDSFDVSQHAPQLSALSATALDPSTSQAAQAQSSWSALSHHSSQDQEQPLSFGPRVQEHERCYTITQSGRVDIGVE